MMQELDSSPALGSLSTNRIQSSSTPVANDHSMDKPTPSIPQQAFNAFYTDYSQSYYGDSQSMDKLAAVFYQATTAYNQQQGIGHQQPSIDYQLHHQYSHHHSQQTQPIKPVLNWNLSPASSSSSKNSSPTQSTSNGGNSSSMVDSFDYYNNPGYIMSTAESAATDTSSSSSSKSIFSTISSNESNIVFSNPFKPTNCYTSSYNSGYPTSHFVHPNQIKIEERKSPELLETSSNKMDNKSQLASSSASSTSSLFIHSPTSINSKLASNAVSPPEHQKQEKQNISVSSTSTSSSVLSNQSNDKPLISECYEWMKPNKSQSNGKTRTKDKYRIVYSDFQRRELEKEFNLCTKYITIKRKSELSSSLKLSERQIKIWFQNRRAKDRKSLRKQKHDNNVTSTSNNLHHANNNDNDRRIHSDCSSDEDECDDNDEDDELYNCEDNQTKDGSDEVKIDVSSSSNPQVKPNEEVKPLKGKSAKSKRTKSKTTESKTKTESVDDSTNGFFNNRVAPETYLSNATHQYQYGQYQSTIPDQSSNQFYPIYSSNGAFYTNSTYHPHHQADYNPYLSYPSATTAASSYMSQDHAANLTQSASTAGYFNNGFVSQLKSNHHHLNMFEATNTSSPASSISPQSLSLLPNTSAASQLVANNPLSQFQPV